MTAFLKATVSIERPLWVDKRLSPFKASLPETGRAGAGLPFLPWVGTGTCGTPRVSWWRSRHSTPVLHRFSALELKRCRPRRICTELRRFWNADWPQTHMDAHSEHRPVTPRGSRVRAPSTPPTSKENGPSRPVFSFLSTPFAPPLASLASQAATGCDKQPCKPSVLFRERCDRKDKGQRAAAETDEAEMFVERSGGLVLGINDQREDAHA